MNKTFKIIIVIVGVLIIGGAIFASKNYSSSAPAYDKYHEGSDWETYTNQRAGITLKYPSNWETRENVGFVVEVYDPERPGKDDTDVPKEAVTVFYNPPQCNEVAWEKGMGDIYYQTKCINIESGVIQISSSAFDEAGKQIAEGIIANLKIDNNLVASPTPNHPNSLGDQIGDTPMIEVLSPNGGEVIRQNNQYSITWQYAGLEYNDMVTITFRNQNYDPCWVGKSEVRMKSFNFTPSKVTCDGTPSALKPGQYKVQIFVDKYDTGKGLADMSDNYFTITN